MREHYLANGGRERMESSLRERRAIDALMEEIMTPGEEEDAGSEAAAPDLEVESEND